MDSWVFKKCPDFFLFIFYLPKFHDFSKYLREVKGDNEALLELEGVCCMCAHSRG